MRLKDTATSDAKAETSCALTRSVNCDDGFILSNQTEIGSLIRPMFASMPSDENFMVRNSVVLGSQEITDVMVSFFIL
jgi:hypothetical protein